MNLTEFAEKYGCIALIVVVILLLAYIISTASGEKMVGYTNGTPPDHILFRAAMGF